MLSIAHRTTQINQTLLFMIKKITSGLQSKGAECNIGKIQERELYKQAKYTELGAEMKRLYKVKEIQQINAVFDFLAGLNKTLERNLKHFTSGKQTAKKVIQQVRNGFIFNIFTMHEMNDCFFYQYVCPGPKSISCNHKSQKCFLSYNLTSTMPLTVRLLPIPDETAPLVRLVVFPQLSH